MRALVLAAAAVATLCLVGLTTAPCTDRSQSIDAIIGTGAFNRVHPVKPGTPQEVHRQISQRLVYLESLLRSRDVSNWPVELQQARTRTLDNLHEYRVNDLFAINYDRPDEHLPCFMDRNGNFCAVAWLIATSAGLPLAQELNSRYQYATISEMHSPELDRWIAHSGLTRAEVITIQVPEGRGFSGDDGFSIRGGRDLAPPVRIEGVNGADTVGTGPAHADSTQQTNDATPVLSDGGQP